jgi:hypothetical protein
MTKIVTSVTLFNDAVGKRISMTYSEVDESGTIISDNKRVDRIVTDQSIVTKANEIAAYAQSIIDSI